jgi:hypothetical protein
VSDELKPCPCCDGYAALDRYDRYIVYCRHCGIRTRKHLNKENAMAAWNRRAQPTIPEIPARTPPIDPDLLDAGKEPKR